MTQISNQKLYDYNRQGFIPGPGESDKDYIERVEYCCNLRQHLKGKLPFGEKAEASQEKIEPGIERASLLFDIRPDWIPVFLSDHKLPPWHAACAWIFQIEEKHPTAAIIQLRKKSWVDSDEAIAHEMCHAAKMTFGEDRYEEIFAYQTSKAGWRRIFGPIIERPMESNLFVILVGLMILVDFFALRSERLIELILWSKLFVLIPIGWACIRLFRKWRFFNKALKNAEKISDKPLALLFRLSGTEIEKAAKSSPEKLVDSILTELKGTLRGRILASYLCTLSHEHSIPHAFRPLQTVLE